jgi:hypothetical protein
VVSQINSNTESLLWTIFLVQLHFTLCRNYKFYPQREIPCEVVTAFEKWYNSLSEDWQRLVLNNIIAKLSVVKIEYADDELPF